MGGEVLSPCFVSSAAAGTGLSAPLSGDVVLPTEPATGDEIVLVDRFQSVLTWVELATAQVRAQLSVATGFRANPQDYVATGPHHAYVSRYEHNFAAGSEPFDRGDDVLAIDPATPRITGRIDLRETMAGAGEGYLPRAGRMVLVGSRLFVLLSAYSADFKDAAPSRLVAIDTARDTIAGVTVLAGLHGCGALARSPSGERLAVACSGNFHGTSAPALEQSGLVVLAVPPQPSPGPLAELGRYPAAGLAGQPLGFSVDFRDEHQLLVTALGREAMGAEPAVTDALVELDTARGTSRVVLRTPTRPFELGEVRCTAPCPRCLAADAEQGVVRVLAPAGANGALGETGAVAPDPAIGLPPRLIGRF
ncbi:MAG: hypothetical protein HY744_26775 [Deltaproteobacteria bacterium]|nr:hypothetical protein [Deltaproteobacteria bacterium]